MGLGEDKMDQKAITKARSRLRVAEKAARELVTCKDIQEFTDIWYTFLSAAKNIYTVLEQGAKSSPQSRQWFGAVGNERRGDPLLRYVYEARNDDEHGLEPGAEYVPGRLRIGITKPGFSSEFTINGRSGPGNTLNVQSTDGKPVLIERIPPRIKLVPVKDRTGKCYAPPEMHKNQTLSDNSPINVAGLALSYLTDLVERASKLA
jgi:hypothetical protein